MYHYVALSWKQHDVEAAQAANCHVEALRRDPAGWNETFRCEGLAVLSLPAVDPAMRVYTLRDGAGVIFGRIFSSDDPQRTVRPEDLDGKLLIRSVGAKLTEDYWGAYVAILRSRERQRVMVIRDCSGRIPCFYVDTGTLRVFFSDIRDIAPFGLNFTLNRYWLAAFIARSSVHVRETGLREVIELLAGDCVDLSSTGLTHKCLWNPRSIVARNLRDDYAAAQSRLKHVTEQVVRAWAGQYDRILLKLSGGLDSAVVLGCMARCRAKPAVCLNHYTPSTDDDERTYARRAAAMAAAQLVEVSRLADATTFLHAMSLLPPAPNPDVPSALGMLAADGMRETSERFGCDTIWTGQGGDHVFFQLNTWFPAVDYLLTHRLPYRFPALLYDSAVLSRRSIWSILAQALHYWPNREASPEDPFGRYSNSLANPSAIADLPECYTVSQWRRGTERIPPGKQLQIDLFLDLLNRHKPLAVPGCPYECHPLISQPLLELSLEIPTYHLLRGGRQRAMARAAFVDRVPIEICDREDKGSIRSQARSLIRGSRDVLEDILLDGTLVSLGIVNRARLKDIVVAHDSYRDSEIMPLLACVAVEAWATHWLRPTPNRACRAHDIRA